MVYQTIALTLALLCLLVLNIVMVRLMVYRNHRFVEVIQNIRTDSEFRPGQ